MKKPDVKFRTLSRIPGNTNAFLNILLQLLKSMNSQEVITKAQAFEWFRKHSQVGESFFNNCRQLLWRLEIINPESDEAWFIGEFGRTLLDAPPNQHARLMAVQLILRVTGMLEVLHICVDAGNKGLTLNQVETALLVYFGERLPNAQDRMDWLKACRCLHLMGKSGVRISTFGLELSQQFPLDPIVSVGASPNNFMRQYVPLTDALRRDALNSQDPDRFEETLCRCFEFLGFRVIRKGARGDTDILVIAPVNADRFCFVVDAKTALHGKVRELNAPNVKKHRERYGADFALIVAPDFERSDALRDQAENYQLVLLTVPILCELMELYATRVFPLPLFQTLFENSGLVEEIPRAIRVAVQECKGAFGLALAVFDLLQSVEQRGPIPADKVRWILLGQSGAQPTPEEAEQALALLSHPSIGAIRIDADRNVSITMTKPTLQMVFQQLAVQVCDSPQTSPAMFPER